MVRQTALESFTKDGAIMQKTVLVTGSSGFLGSEVIKHALKKGYRVVALKRKSSQTKSLEHLDIEWRIGDVTDLTSLEIACAGADFCIHTAGATSYDLKDKQLLIDVNITGAENVAKTAKKLGIKRLVHVSSVSAIGFCKDGSTATEETAYNWPQRLSYMETKAAGEKKVLSYADKNFEVVVVNPATIMGPGKMNASEEQLVNEIKNNKVFAIPPGGMTICDIDDVAQGVLLALENGINGQRYILGGHHLSHKDLADKLAIKFHTSCNAKALPAQFFQVLGGIMMWLEPFGINVGTSAAVIRLSRFGIYHSSDKAISALNYKVRPLDEILDRVVSTRK